MGRTPLVRQLTWVQSQRQEVTLTIELSAPVWGYRTRWSRNDLILEVRRPPHLSGTNPLRGRTIAIDPGHPPMGSTGPTGLREAEANLAVALQLRAMLQNAGAKVLMTRVSDSAVDLWPRVAAAEQSGAELLVSIHNNALPDGVNPFTNNGTSVFYNQPRSVPLAAAIQESAGSAAEACPIWESPRRSRGHPRNVDAFCIGGRDVHHHARAGGGASYQEWRAPLCSRRVRGYRGVPAGAGQTSIRRRCGPAESSGVS